MIPPAPPDPFETAPAAPGVAATQAAAGAYGADAQAVAPGAYGASPYAPYAGYGAGYYGGAAAGGYGAGGYGAGGYGAGGYGAGGYGGYGGYGAGYGAGAAMLRRGAAATGVLGGVQDAMARFARVSAAVDDGLRSLHLLFDALFGLGVAANALARELRVALRGKGGPAALFARIAKRVVRVLRLLICAIVSPAAGRLSPLAVLLRLFGFAPRGETRLLDIFDAWQDAADRQVLAIQQPDPVEYNGAAYDEAMRRGATDPFSVGSHDADLMDAFDGASL